MLIVAYVHAYVGMGRNAGAETTLHDILKFLVRNGHEARVVLSQSPGIDDYDVDGVHVHARVDKRTILHWAPQAAVMLTHLESTERAVLLGRKFRTPVVQIIHNDMDITKGYAALGCEAIVFNTEWVRDSFGITESIGLVVHPPVRAEDYSITGDPSKSDYITMVNMWPNKGSSVFYEMASRFPGKKFLAVPGGYGQQDIRTEEYPNVTVADHVMDMREVFSRTRIVLMPSKYESFGRVAMEAASQGIPSLVSPTPGLVEALGPAGIYCPSLDEYARQLKRLSHWKAYAAASAAHRQRYEEFSRTSDAEMMALLATITSVGESAQTLRGW
jgi:glycosyltransferase involved in cell wall biosynthesis